MGIFHQGTGEAEGHPDSGEFMQGMVVGQHLGVHNSLCGGKRLGQVVVICDDDHEAGSSGSFDGLKLADAGIARDEKANTCGDSLIYRSGWQAVALIPIRETIVHASLEKVQCLVEDSGGCLPVGVKVAPYADSLALGYRAT